MTENMPSMPPASRSGPNYPSRAPSGFIRGNEATYGTPLPYDVSPPVANGQQSQYQYPQLGQAPLQYASQWYPLPPVPKCSGIRVAAGIVGIVLGALLLFPALAGSRTT